jgi:hypothetical protein
MPRLIHLNGPSRVGKSALAQRYANEQPGTLALDLDVLAGLALWHLRSGYDVINPQLMTVHDRIPDPALEEAARTADATYIQVALTVGDKEHLQRLHSHGLRHSDPGPWAKAILRASSPAATAPRTWCGVARRST